MQKYSVMFVLICVLLLLPACEQQKNSEREVEKEQAIPYSRETLEKVEKDINKAMQQSVDRLDKALEGNK